MLCQNVGNMSIAAKRIDQRKMILDRRTLTSIICSQHRFLDDLIHLIYIRESKMGLTEVKIIVLLRTLLDY